MTEPLGAATFCLEPELLFCLEPKSAPRPRMSGAAATQKVAAPQHCLLVILLLVFYVCRPQFSLPSLLHYYARNRTITIK